jgi:DNA adenine methylase
MLGGGADFIELARLKRFNRAQLNDSNPELINAWKMIQVNVDGLISELKQDKYRYAQDIYLEIRKESPANLSNLERAARFIYLNKTCFNGLYRVNKSGEFNVPFGNYTNPVICDERNLKEISEILGNVVLSSIDFMESLHMCCEGDAVYFDPPYLPSSKTSCFTSYTEAGFDMTDHIRLRECMKQLSKKGVRVVVSNSATDSAYQLFKEFDIDKLAGRHNVGGSASYRFKIGEIIVFAGPKS